MYKNKSEIKKNIRSYVEDSLTSGYFQTILKTNGKTRIESTKTRKGNADCPGVLARS